MWVVAAGGFPPPNFKFCKRFLWWKKQEAKVNLFELLANDQKDVYEAKKSQLLEVIELSLMDSNKN